MASEVVNDVKRKAIQSLVDGATALTIMLLDDNHITNIDNQVTIDDVNTNEVTGTGYTAGGQAIANPVAVVDNTNNRGELSFDDITWDASGGTLAAAYAVLYDDTGTASSSTIWAIYDFGGLQTADDDIFRVSSDTEGAFQLG